MFRKNKSLSQATLAELCDVSNGTIGNIECGVTKPSFDLILKMAEVLDISPADFFSSKDNSTVISLSVLEDKIHRCIKDIFKENSSNGL